jgi:hypothetical protein
VHVFARIAAATVLPSDKVDLSLASRADFVRGGASLVLAGVCLGIVSAGAANLIAAYHEDEAHRPVDAATVSGAGNALAALLIISGVFYATRANSEGRAATVLTSIAAAIFAGAVAFAFLRAGRAIIVAYAAIAVGLAHAALSVLMINAGSIVTETRELPAALASAGLAVLVAMLGFTVGAGADD